MYKHNLFIEHISFLNKLSAFFKIYMQYFFTQCFRLTIDIKIKLKLIQIKL